MICRIDADDVCFPNRIECQLSFLQNHKDYVLVSSAVRYIDEYGKDIGRSFPCTLDKSLKKSLSTCNMIVHPMSMFRKESYFASGGYIGIKRGQDHLYWSRLAKFGKLSPL